MKGQRWHVCWPPAPLPGLMGFLVLWTALEQSSLGQPDSPPGLSDGAGRLWPSAWTSLPRSQRREQGPAGVG